jgi:hypothetical protein
VANGAVHQIYRCDPGLLDGKHEFSVLRTGADELIPLYSPPPTCPLHGADPSRKVVRAGWYGAPDNKRQQYLCAAIRPQEVAKDDFDPEAHRFTPELPRKHIHPGEDRCGTCSELIGVHRGAQSAARRTSWDLQVVSQSLIRLADGQTYSAVSRWAWEVTNRERTRHAKLSPAERARRQAIKVWMAKVRAATKAGKKPPRRPKKASPVPLAAATDYVRRRRSTTTGTPRKPAHRSDGALLAARRWHTAADWTEVYAPAIWGPHATELRAIEQAAYVARQDLSVEERRLSRTPHILYLDEAFVFSKSKSRIGRTDIQGLYTVFVVGQADWTTSKRGFTATPKLRLMRALGSSAADAWMLVLSELGYEPGGDYYPDFVVTDGGAAIEGAMRRMFPNTVRIPSLWHLLRSIEDTLRRLPGSTRRTEEGTALIPDLAGHLTRLSADRLRDMTSQHWSGWWDDLIRIAARNELPTETIVSKRAEYEGAVLTALPYLVANTSLPVATGGYERVLANATGSVLAGRARSHRSVERLNSLLDMVVARHQGAMNSPEAVANQLRAFVAKSGGWGPQPREIADPQPDDGAYSSLRDPHLVAALVRANGLTS